MHSLALSVVVPVVLAFLLAQLSVFFSLRRSLKKLGKELRGAAQGNGKLQPELHSWLEWLSMTFDAQQASAVDISRNECFEELDRSLNDDLRFNILSRLSIAAPLLGVILTAVGFWGFEPPSDTEAFSEIVQSITPMFVGVGAGALLALINQGLLAITEFQHGDVKDSARIWFDKFVWKSRVGPLDRSTQALTEVASSLRATSTDQSASIATMRSVADLMHNVANEFRLNLQTFVSEMKGLPQNLPRLAEVVNEAADKFGRIVPQCVSAASEFSSSVLKFRQVTEENIAKTYEYQNATAADISESTSRLSESIATLTEGSIKATNVIEEFGSAGAKLLDSLQSSILPYQSYLGGTTERLEWVTGEIKDELVRMQQSFANASQQSIAASEVFSTLAKVSQEFQRHMQEQMGPASQNIRAAAVDIQVIMSNVSDSTSRIEEAALRLADAAKDTSTGAALLKQSVEREVVASHQFLGRATKNFDATAESLLEHADRFRSAIESVAGDYNRFLVRLSASLPEDLSGSLAEFSKSIRDKFSAAVEAQYQAASRYTDSINSFESSIAAFGQSASVLRDASGLASQFQSSSLGGIDRIRSAYSALEQNAKLAYESILQTSEPINMAASRYAEALLQSSKKLEEITEIGIEPVLGKLAAFDQAVSNINLALGSIRQVTSNGNEIQQLNAALEKLLKVAEQLGSAIDKIPPPTEGRPRRWFFQGNRI